MHTNSQPDTTDARDLGLHTGSWWHPIAHDRIQCDLCPRHCKLRDGQRAFCFVRQNVGGRMMLTTYGMSTGFCVDPIEKKPLNHFLPGTPTLSFGTAGCNLGCRFCQNWTSSKARETDLLTDRATPDAIADAALQAGCRSVAFTYNDPVIWAEYAIDTAKACHERGIRTVAVTAGYMEPEPRRAFYARIDAANVDLKGFSEHFYHRLALGHLQNVLDTLHWLKHETSVWLEITTLLIPGENDSEDEIGRMCDWIVEHLGVDVPLHFTAFHPDFKLLDRPPTPPSTLQRARKQAMQRGIRYVYTGNIRDALGQSTFCPGCGGRVIARDGYELSDWKIRKGRCAECEHPISGVFEDQPGTWGARRMPVRLRTR